jgi:hypothetical protein
MSIQSKVKSRMSLKFIKKSDLPEKASQEDQTTQAYITGWSDCCQGLSFEENPYSGSDETVAEAAVWSKAWKEAKKKSK